MYDITVYTIMLYSQKYVYKYWNDYQPIFDTIIEYIGLTKL